MKAELYWLTLTIITTALFWVPYIINRILENGLIPALRNPNKGESPNAQWANRMGHAHTNAVENLVLFAPLVLMIEVLQISSTLTQIACMVFFITRTCHFLTYSFGIAYFRTLFFFVGFLVQFFLAVSILNTISV